MRKRKREVPPISSAGIGTGITNPTNIHARPVVARTVLNQSRDFTEAMFQTKPLASAGSREAEQAAKLLRNATARPQGLRSDTANDLVSKDGQISNFALGANAKGKTAEVIVARELQGLHVERDANVVNAPKRPSNLESVRISPDISSRRDLLFQVRTRGGMLLTAPGGQVKNGASQYVADSLVKMAKTPGYGRTGYVDAHVL